MPEIVISTVVLVIGTLVLSMYLGGGSAAIRRQLPQLGLLGLAVVAVAVAVPLLMQGLGDVVLIALLVMSAAVGVMWLRRPRRG